MLKLPPEPALAGWRYEIKFSGAESALDRAAVKSLIRSHEAGFREAYPPRQVNNVYFDTHERSDLSDHLAGVPGRAKLRLRWYGPDRHVVGGRLEHKQKQGQLGRKVVVDLGCDLDLAQMTWREVVAEMGRQDLGSLGPTFASWCCPVILNTYAREYYVSMEGSARLTLDTHLHFYAQTCCPRPNLSRRLDAEALIVVELKADADQHRSLQEVSANFPLRPSAHSKYVRGALGAHFI